MVSYLILTPAISWAITTNTPRWRRTHFRLSISRACPPTKWRILTPLTVWALHLGIYVGFWLVTNAGLLLGLVSLLWFLAGLQVSRPAILAGGLAFVCLGPLVGFSLYEDMRIDALSSGLLLLGLAATVHRKGWLVCLSLTLGMVSKETAIFGGIFALLWALERRDARLLRWAQATLIVQLLIYAALRHLIQPAYGYSFLIEFQQTYRGLGPLDLLNKALLATVGTWGLLLPLALWHAWQPRTLWRSPALLSLLLLCYAQLVVASDVERVVVYAFPVVIAAAALAVEDLSARWHVSRWALWGPVLLVQVTWSYTYAPSLPWILAPLHGLGLLLASLLTLAVLLWRVWERRGVRVLGGMSHASPETPAGPAGFAP